VLINGQCNLIKASAFLLSNPWESTQDRNDDEEVGDDTSGNHSGMLDSMVADDVDDLEYQPTKGSVNISLFGFQ